MLSETPVESSKYDAKQDNFDTKRQDGLRQIAPEERCQTRAAVEAVDLPTQCTASTTSE